MQLHVWTDGTYSREILLCNSVILTEDTFIKRVIQKINVNSTYEAEVLSVTQAMSYLHTMVLDPYERVVVYTDAEAVTIRYYEIITGKRKLEDTRFKRMWSELLHLIETLPIPVEMIHYPGHSSEHNPNKLCDITGKIVSKCFMGM